MASERTYTETQLREVVAETIRWVEQAAGGGIFTDPASAVAYILERRAAQPAPSDLDIALAKHGVLKPAPSPVEPECVLRHVYDAGRPHCLTHDAMPEWVECTGYRCPVSGKIITRHETDEEYQAREAKENPPAKGEGQWTCKARSGGDPAEPQDCDWPHCGCDPAASKVVSALIEEGWTKPSIWKDPTPATTPGTWSVDARLDTLAALEADWDSYGAPPIKPEAIAFARDIARGLAAAGLSEPCVVPVCTESVQFEWHDADGAVREVEIFVHPGKPSLDHPVEEPTSALLREAAAANGAPEDVAKWAHDLAQKTAGIDD